MDQTFRFLSWHESKYLLSVVKHNEVGFYYLLNLKFLAN